MYEKKIKTIHFIGIGGAGMCGIAEVLNNLGYTISGSDLEESSVTKRLLTLGIKVFIGHDKANLRLADCVVRSTAIKDDNVEIKEAKRLKLPVMARAEMLSELMRLKHGIAVAGTHGKTTTTSMIASIFTLANIDPTMVVGGKLNLLGTNAKLGTSNVLIAEADESDRSFLKLSPVVTVVNNIDRDHMENYADMEDLKNSFLEFMHKVPFYGLCVVNGDDEFIKEILSKVHRRILTFGLGEENNIIAKNISYASFGASYEVHSMGVMLGVINLKVPGEYNLRNSLASVTVAIDHGIDFEIIKEALEAFSGVERRFEDKGMAGGAHFFDDYGHHPVEIKEVLKAARLSHKGRIVTAFQPHRYSRTKDLYEDFLNSFTDTDVLIITEIYGAGDEKLEDISGMKLLEEIKKENGKEYYYCETIKNVSEKIAEVAREGDLIITLGAGDIWKSIEAAKGILEKKG